MEAMTLRRILEERGVNAEESQSQNQYSQQMNPTSSFDQSQSQQQQFHQNSAASIVTSS